MLHTELSPRQKQLLLGSLKLDLEELSERLQNIEDGLNCNIVNYFDNNYEALHSYVIAIEKLVN